MKYKISAFIAILIALVSLSTITANAAVPGAKLFEVGDVLPATTDLRIYFDGYQQFRDPKINSDNDIYVFFDRFYYVYDCFVGKSIDHDDIQPSNSMTEIWDEDHSRWVLPFNSTDRNYIDIDTSTWTVGKRTISNVGTIGTGFSWLDMAPAPSSYAISFNSNGGTSVSNIEDATELPSPLPTTTKSGYTFLGWFYESDFITAATPGATISADTTLYAKWTLATYSISYYNEDHTAITGLSPSSYTAFPTTVINLPIPTKDGYNFLGWYDVDLIDEIENIPIGSTGDYHLFAQWERSVYGITYYDGDIELNLTPNTYDYSIGLSLPTPTKTGYDFIGWRYNHGEGETGYSIITNIPANGLGIYSGSDYELYAVWQSQTYNITYFDGEEELTDMFLSADTTFNYIQGKTLPDNEYLFDIFHDNNYIRDGYKLIAWRYYDSTLQGGYSDITSIQANNFPRDFKLYAVFELVTYPLKYYDGNTQLTLTPSSFNVENHVILPIPTKDGYQFLGWYGNQNFTGERYYQTNGLLASGYIPNFYAKWEAVNFAIVYYDGSTVLNNLTPNIYNTGALTTLPIPTKYGYEFIGWYEDEYFEDDLITEIALGSTGNKTFYSRWERVLYSITYKDGNSELTLTPNVYDYRTGLTLPIPIKTGYRFIAWRYNHGSGEDGYSDFTSISANPLGIPNPVDYTLSAQWEMETYTITYYDGTQVLIQLQPQSYTFVHDPIILPEITKGNFVFDGWYSDSQLTQRVNALLSVDYGNKTFYAKWQGDFINETTKIIYKNPNAILTVSDIINILKDEMRLYGDFYNLEMITDGYTGNGNISGSYIINFNLLRNNTTIRNFDFEVVVNESIVCRYYYNKVFYIGSDDEFTYENYISVLRYLGDLPNADINYTILSSLRTDSTKDYFLLENKINGVYETIINYSSTAGYNGSRRYLLNLYETTPYSVIEKVDYTLTSAEKTLILSVLGALIIGGVIVYVKVIKPKMGKKNNKNNSSINYYKKGGSKRR